MRNQSHYDRLGVEVYDICRLNMSRDEFIGAMKWSIEKYVWRDKGDSVKDAQKIQVYARWLEMAQDMTQIDEHKAINDLCKKIPKGKYTAIYTTGRGGLWVASMVAYYLDIKNVHTDNEPDQTHVRPEDMLFVDDIADTGKTIKDIKIDTAVLVKRHTCPIEPTYVGTVANHEEYIKFQFQGGN